MPFIKTNKKGKRDTNENPKSLSLQLNAGLKQFSKITNPSRYSHKTDRYY